jgi:hypothetical protein
MMLALPVFATRFILSGRPLASNPMRWPIIAYFVICVFSTLLNASGGVLVEGLVSMMQMALYMGVAVFIFANCAQGYERVVPALYGILLSDLFLSGMLLITGSQYVLGLHKNGIGSELDYAVVIAVELWFARTIRRQNTWLILLTLAITGAGLVYSLSRGAWLGTLVGSAVILILRGRVGLAIRALLVSIPVFACCWFLLPEQSKDYAVDFGPDARNIQARYRSLSYAYDLFKQNPVIGMGVGLRKTYDATNVVMSTLAETGISGLVAFLSIFGMFFWMVWKTRQSMDPKHPLFSLLVIGAGLMAAKFAHGLVDHYWSRVMLPVWSSAGMAVFCYNSARNRKMGT